MTLSTPKSSVSFEDDRRVQFRLADRDGITEITVNDQGEWAIEASNGEALNRLFTAMIRADRALAAREQEGEVRHA